MRSKRLGSGGVKRCRVRSKSCFPLKQQNGDSDVITFTVSVQATLKINQKADAPIRFESHMRVSQLTRHKDMFI